MENANYKAFTEKFKDFGQNNISTVFQSYLDDGQMILKGCAQWNPVYG